MAEPPTIIGSQHSPHSHSSPPSRAIGRSTVSTIVQQFEALGGGSNNAGSSSSGSRRSPRFPVLDLTQVYRSATLPTPKAKTPPGTSSGSDPHHFITPSERSLHRNKSMTHVHSTVMEPPSPTPYLPLSDIPKAETPTSNSGGRGRASSRPISVGRGRRSRSHNSKPVVQHPEHDPHVSSSAPAALSCSSEPTSSSPLSPRIFLERLASSFTGSRSMPKEIDGYKKWVISQLKQQIMQSKLPKISKADIAAYSNHARHTPTSSSSSSSAPPESYDHSISQLLLKLQGRLTFLVEQVRSLECPSTGKRREWRDLLQRRLEALHYSSCSLTLLLATYESIGKIPGKNHISESIVQIALAGIGGLKTLGALQKAKEQRDAQLNDLINTQSLETLLAHLNAESYSWPISFTEREEARQQWNVDLALGARRSLVAGGACQFNSITYTTLRDGAIAKRTTLENRYEKGLDERGEQSVIKDVLEYLRNSGFQSNRHWDLNLLAEKTHQAEETFCSNALRAISVSAFTPARNIVANCLAIRQDGPYRIWYPKENCHPEIIVDSQSRRFTGVINKPITLHRMVGADKIAIADIRCTWRQTWDEKTRQLSGDCRFTLAFTEHALQEDKRTILENWLKGSDTYKW